MDIPRSEVLNVFWTAKTTLGLLSRHCICLRPSNIAYIARSLSSPVIKITAHEVTLPRYLLMKMSGCCSTTTEGSMEYTEGTDVTKDVASDTDTKAFSWMRSPHVLVRSRPGVRTRTSSPAQSSFQCTANAQSDCMATTSIILSWTSTNIPKTKSQPLGVHNALGRLGEICLEDKDMHLPSIMIVAWISEVKEEEQNRLAEEDGEGAEALVGSYSTKKRIRWLQEHMNGHSGTSSSQWWTYDATGWVSHPCASDYRAFLRVWGLWVSATGSLQRGYPLCPLTSRFCFSTIADLKIKVLCSRDPCAPIIVVAKCASGVVEGESLRIRLSYNHDISI
ncbi:hypothetical protein M422DRAFT_242936 [Sphaerobolus stellatus SS14]|nr:hypothetical protein M422DRAFT_242936 [Sphaerobolus stellatus SS14]